MIVLVRPVAAAVGVGQVSSFKPQGYHTTGARNHAAPSVAAAALYEQTSNGAASAAAGSRRTVRPFWFGESWHVEYHPRVIIPWNIASKRATAVTTLTNYA